MPSHDSNTKAANKKVWITVDTSNHSLCGYYCPQFKFKEKRCKAFNKTINLIKRHDGEEVGQRLKECIENEN